MRSDYKYIHEPDFLSQDLHELMLDPENQRADKPGAIITESGQIWPVSDNLIKNYCSDQSVLHSFLPLPFVQLLKEMRVVLIEQGMTDPKVRHLTTMINPEEAKPGELSHGWHKDYNVEKVITDPMKLWITFFTLTPNAVNSKISMSPTADGPSQWGIGTEATLHSNTFLGHNFNIGHHYKESTDDELNMIYIRWYDE